MGFNLTFYCDLCGRSESLSGLESAITTSDAKPGEKVYYTIEGMEREKYATDNPIGDSHCVRHDIPAPLGNILRICDKCYAKLLADSYKWQGIPTSEYITYLNNFKAKESKYFYLGTCSS